MATSLATVSIPMHGSATSGGGAEETGGDEAKMWRRGGPPPSQDRKRASGCFSYTATSDATARAHDQQFRIAPLLYAVSHPAMRCNGGAHGWARTGEEGSG